MSLTVQGSEYGEKALQACRRATIAQEDTNPQGAEIRGPECVEKAGRRATSAQDVNPQETEIQHLLLVTAALKGHLQN